MVCSNLPKGCLPTGTTFREAFLVACDQNPRAIRGKTRLLRRVQRADPRRNRNARRWARIEERTAARYKKDTGRVVTDFGDGHFLQWLIDNLPAILSLIMKLLALFGI